MDEKPQAGKLEPRTVPEPNYGKGLKTVKVRKHG
jgi:hypothetical protein